MKNKSLKGIVIFITLITMHTGCNPQSNTSKTKEKIQEGVSLVKRAKFLRHEGDIDSSIAYYRKSIFICYILEKQTDSGKDTIYSREIAKLNFSIGSIYDSLNRLDSVTKYLVESIKWAKLSKTPNLIISDEGLMGYMYYNAGNKYNQGSLERKKFYSSGVEYLVSSCRNMDSVGLLKNNVKLQLYNLINPMYEELGDSNKAAFYRNKYNELKAQLNSGSDQ